MRRLINNIFYSFPVQLFILHFRKYQVLLLFWYLLFSTVNSQFLKSYGADALFFVPEYMGNVNALSTALVGVAAGVFFMSWNITTFILHTKRFKFLAAASKPFLKYCINNAVMPLLFLIFYLIRALQFNISKELMSTSEVLLLVLGFVCGLILLLAFSFAFFFGADRQILRSFAPVVADKELFRSSYDPGAKPQVDGFGMKVGYYFSVSFRLRKARNVSHYSEYFLDSIFKRHHFAAVVAMVLAFVFLIIGGFFLDVKFFQVPAAVSIIVFFAIMVAVIGALTYFLQSWSVLFIVLLLQIVNVLYHQEIIDPRNKAYGINYNNTQQRPVYNKASLQQLCTPQKIAADSLHMIQILQHWKQKQTVQKPVIVFINVSGGGLRSATFTMNMLQQLNRVSQGELMNQAFLISGASGGMLSAAYFRELYLQYKKDSTLNLYSTQHVSGITQDLLNPVFTSMVSRDIFSPAQKFSVGPYRYIKDRGYAFEQKLNENANGLLGKQVKDYEADEYAAKIPMIIFNSVITRDGRKMMIGAQPLSFMMKPLAFAQDTSYSPDAVDFAAFFKNQHPRNIRLLTALRMNATFPYVLPNVWLPCSPVIDVMDAGLRDNFGQETTLRFIDYFKDWIKENTGGVLVVQLRDHVTDNWQQPLETGTLDDVIIKPATMLQHNWYKLQDYFQNDQFSYKQSAATFPFNRFVFMYVPAKEEKSAVLNFHLTASEKQDVINSFNSAHNQHVLQQLLVSLKPSN
ncbi:MAG: hypothetical protein RL172_1550 [Bacteroidota bacterium]|jgi:hypothetical protein